MGGFFYLLHTFLHASKINRIYVKDQLWAKSQWFSLESSPSSDNILPKGFLTFTDLLFFSSFFLFTLKCQRIKYVNTFDISTYTVFTYRFWRRPWWTIVFILNSAKSDLDRHGYSSKPLRWLIWKRWRDIRLIQSIHLSVFTRERRKRGGCCRVSVTEWVCLRRLVREINSWVHLCHWVPLNLDTAWRYYQVTEVNDIAAEEETEPGCMQIPEGIDWGERCNNVSSHHASHTVYGYHKASQQSWNKDFSSRGQELLSLFFYNAFVIFRI